MPFTPIATEDELLEINVPSSAYMAMAKRWIVPRLLMGGTQSVRDAHLITLPQFPKETADDYKRRWQSADLYNVFEQAVQTLVGEVFDKAIQINPDLDPEVRGWLENVDQLGTDFNSFAKMLFEDALVPGKAHVWVDTPAAEIGEDGEPVTLSGPEQREKGIRPFLVHYRAEDAIGWRPMRVNGQEVPKLIRLREVATVESGRWLTKEVDRVLAAWLSDDGKSVTWLRAESKEPRKTSITEPAEPTQFKEIGNGSIPIDEVPFVTLYTRKLGFLLALPPLDDLADVQLTHFRSSSDQRNILHFVRVAILFAKGMQSTELDDVISIGGGLLITAQQPDADMKVVEHTGAAIEAGERDLANLERQMETLAMAPQVKPVQVTAAEVKQDKQQTSSGLKAMAIDLEKALNRIVEVMCKLGGKPFIPNAITVHKDFALPVGTVLADRLIKLATIGVYKWTDVCKALEEAGEVPPGIPVHEPEVPDDPRDKKKPALPKAA